MSPGLKGVRIRVIFPIRSQRCQLISRWFERAMGLRRRRRRRWWCYRPTKSTTMMTPTTKMSTSTAMKRKT